MYVSKRSGNVERLSSDMTNIFIILKVVFVEIKYYWLIFKIPNKDVDINFILFNLER